MSKWILSHIEDGDKELNKPVMFTEFGFSTENKNYDPAKRDRFFKTVFDVMYQSARKNRAGAGCFVWQFFVGGMEEYNDDFGIVPWERPATYGIITEHSCRLAKIHGHLVQHESIVKDLCSRRRL